MIGSRVRAVRLPLALACAGAVVLAGCTSETADQDTPATPSSAAPSTPPALPTVPGYAVGDFPPVPLITLPDLSLLDTATAGFALDLTAVVGDLPGLTVSPAVCDGSEVRTGNGALLAYGDGSGSYTGPDGSVMNFGDGTGSYELNGVSVTVAADGSGVYDDGTTRVYASGDGSGSYDDGTLRVHIAGDGSATSDDGTTRTRVEGDGSGTYDDDSVRITVAADGSGSFDDGTIRIVNNGDGTGEVDGQPIDVEPLPPVPPVGTFPSMGALAPLDSCGTTITLQDAVLFDFGSSAVRADAAVGLDTLATALIGVGAPVIEVGGHTDAVGDDPVNLVLSEDRAAAVVAALTDRGVTASMTAVGHGESVPVAPNEIDGVDNPAGRQLNRRVEIFVPAF